jgi:hypothetical protein
MCDLENISLLDPDWLKLTDEEKEEFSRVIDESGVDAGVAWLKEKPKPTIH